MPIYKAPLEDIRFVLNEVVKTPALADWPSASRVEALLTEAAQLAETVLFPLNASGDLEGCAFKDGKVKTPKGFVEAYDQFRKGGWTRLSCGSECGGQGLPLLFNFVVNELVSSSNLSFSLYPILSHAAYKTIEKHAAEDLKKTYLPKLVEGVWTGAMCLSEPQSGTDIGLIKTMAESQADGSYKLTGEKIFISSGDHDLSENIVYLVLARTLGALPGVRGLSLFLVPKIIPNTGAKNGVVCARLEQKMGVHASATCALNFEGASGWLVGDLGKGASSMFTMVNEARMTVGIQGLGIAEIAYQNAAAYAKRRLQMRSLKGVKYQSKPADPILVHPDIRQRLLTIRSLTEGCRALAYWVGSKFDIAAGHADAKVRAEAADLVALMIPVVKSFMTDVGSEAANNALQIFGGHGYIRDNGIEQFVRDVRITQIYEGTNGIQALDLVMRKMADDYGRLLRSFFHPVTRFLAEQRGNPVLASYIPPFTSAFSKLQMASIYIVSRSAGNTNEVGTGAADYLNIFAYVALGYMWLKMALAADAGKKAGGTNAAFYEAKLKTANFYFSRILPQVHAHYRALITGADPIMDFPSEAF